MPSLKLFLLMQLLDSVSKAQTSNAAHKTRGDEDSEIAELQFQPLRVVELLRLQ